MKIAICEAHNSERANKLKTIQLFLLSKNINCEICLYHTKKKLLSTIVTNNIKYDIIICDLFFGKSNDLSIMKEISEIHKDTSTLFLTISSDFVIKKYSNDILSEYINFVNLALIDSLIDIIIRQYINNYIIIKNADGMIIKIMINDITSAESNDKKITIHTKNKEKIIIQGQLSQLEAQLTTNNFIRPHQSFIVNMDYIEKVTDNFIMITDEIVLIRKRHYYKFKKIYVNYLLSQKKL